MQFWYNIIFKYLSFWDLFSSCVLWIFPNASSKTLTALISFSGLPVGRGPNKVRLSRYFLASPALNPLNREKNKPRNIFYMHYLLSLLYQTSYNFKELPVSWFDAVFACGKWECAYCAAHQLMITVFKIIRHPITPFSGLGAIVYLKISYKYIGFNLYKQMPFLYIILFMKYLANYPLK